MTIAEWSLPSVALIFLPKCPACLAAYIALGTGIGLSFSTAAHLRTGIAVASLLLLTYLVARQSLRIARWMKRNEQLIEGDRT